MRAPGYRNWDLAAEKYWHFTEEVRLQLRAEMYAFNHANFYAPNQYLGNRGPLVNGQYTGSFATIGNAFPARDVQFAMKLYW